LLIVAEKYQTGFDQPLLHTMYVDKKLAGLHAVQTLSRLNRTHPDKAPDDTFVLDFVNEAAEIRGAFAPYYEVAAIDEPTDPNQVFTLKNQLDDFHYYYQQDVEDFVRSRRKETLEPTKLSRCGHDTHRRVDRRYS
jgi:type I restriction enzyme R subunit